MADSKDDDASSANIGSTESTGDTLERLRNIAQMFNMSGKDEEQQLQKVEKLQPGDKIKNTFQKFEEGGSANGLHDEADEETGDEEASTTDGIIRSHKKPLKEQVPFHEMAEVKDRFEKGNLDSDKPRVEKRLDVRVQSGMASTKKAQFEQGEYEQEVEPHVSKVQVETDLVAGVASDKRAHFERGGESETEIQRTVVVDRESLAGVAQEKMAKFEKGEFESMSDHAGKVVIDRDALAGAAQEKKKKFEEGKFEEHEHVIRQQVDPVQSGLASEKRNEFIAKIDAEAQVQRSGDRHVDLEVTEHGLASTRRDQLTSLASSEYRHGERQLEGVEEGKTSLIKEQYMKETQSGEAKASSEHHTPVIVESGLAKNRATAFENPDETTIKRTVEIESDLLERGVAKERMALFKNLESGHPSSGQLSGGGDSKLRVDDEPDLSRRQSGSYSDDKNNIESGHAKAVRERFLQNAEQNTVTTGKKTIKQITPPPADSVRRKSSTPPESSSSSGVTEQYANNEEIVPTKGQAGALKNRFAELEKDALKVETAASKIKHVPKRFVDTPAPKQNNNVEPSIDPNKCCVCQKTVYAMEKVEADKKIYHKSCFKCTQCKSQLKLGNFTANEGQIYCKPHYLQLFAVKGNYSAGFGRDDHKTRWSQARRPSTTSNQEN